MCNSGKCDYENTLGECTVHNISLYEDTYGYLPCLIGGFCTSKEEYDFYLSHQSIINEIKNKYSESLYLSG